MTARSPARCVLARGRLLPASEGDRAVAGAAGRSSAAASRCSATSSGSRRSTRCAARSSSWSLLASLLRLARRRSAPAASRACSRRWSIVAARGAGDRRRLAAAGGLADDAGDRRAWSRRGASRRSSGAQGARLLQRRSPGRSAAPWSRWSALVAEHAALVHSAAGAGAAAADLGLAHLPRVRASTCSPMHASRDERRAAAARRTAGRCSAWACSPATSARRRRCSGRSSALTLRASRRS